MDPINQDVRVNFAWTGSIITLGCPADRPEPRMAKNLNFESLNVFNKVRNGMGCERA
jgi:hypothetical protein